MYLYLHRKCNVVGDVTAVLNERYSMDNQLHRRLQQRIHHSPHVYTELALTDTSTVLQVVTLQHT